MSSIVRVRWAAPTAAVALGVLTIGGSLTHVPLDIWTHQVHGGQGDLVGAVDAAFQPAHVSVWLPPRT